ncbi:glycerophosphoryl diester phosphodiesterase membrane domain-containing protein [Secundilactobacillus collinoides]|uniref:glycerophosphoryl diester phosphodiesterase membrane domain-containing protein n=1 Tax=Secundilactobacillus collinoides TaxID=33960 RepID=UPI002436E924|nr:glycerophosphoryl diester phosphodiesterase membrane domain-containing protein [Secundilactobacillus collinoides]
MIQGIEGIHHNQERRLTRITLSALQAMRQLRVSSFIFFIPYFVLILPFSDMFFYFTAIVKNSTSGLYSHLYGK